MKRLLLEVAVFVDREHDFVDADDPVPVQIAAADAFAARAGELGVSARI
jgi:hypothetical protein